jgi:hypothetical protein
VWLRAKNPAALLTLPKLPKFQKLPKLIAKTNFGGYGNPAILTIDYLL